MGFVKHTAPAAIEDRHEEPERDPEEEHPEDEHIDPEEAGEPDPDED